MDCAFIKIKERERVKPILTFIETTTGTCGTIIAPNKSANRYSVASVKKFIIENGFSKSTIQVDDEPGIMLPASTISKELGMPCRQTPIRVKAQWRGFPSELGLPSGTLWKLQKALYGLKTSPRQWQQHLTNILVKELKFHQSKCDPNLFIGPSNNIMVLVYVDDLFITGKKEVGEEFISNIRERLQLKH
eukprot:2221458-Amphidinium_carterae.2